MSNNDLVGFIARPQEVKIGDPVYVNYSKHGTVMMMTNEKCCHVCEALEKLPKAIQDKIFILMRLTI